MPNIELAPNILVYDKSSKTYIVGTNFSALYHRSSAQRFLAELLATKAGFMEKYGSFIGAAPDFDWTKPPWRALNEHNVEAIVRAIRESACIDVIYQSMSSTEPIKQRLSPHGLGHDGFRWHVRAYCHLRGRFSDFVLARFVDIQQTGTRHKLVFTRFI